jgi:DNA-nicking Smr family endonuclease
MSRSGGKSGKPSRPIAPDEAELWSRVAQTVEKVKKKPRVPSHADELPAPPPVSPSSTPAAAKEKKHRHASRAPAPPAPPPPPPPRVAPLAELDRRTVRQIAGGKAPIDARLDLHGMRQSDARVELRAFLRAAQGRGCRTVLVITGKGGAAAERDPLAGALGRSQRGVLRHAVPQWLQEPDMREVVLSFTTAGVRHGGEGALYVQLRKPRGT